MKRLTNQTPVWEGTRLGGWARIHAYDSNRFNDKAALYAAIEYRVISQLPLSQTPHGTLL